MKKIALALVMMLIVSACSLSKDTPQQQTLWVKISPKQCLQNPWEQYWIEQNKDKFPDERALAKAFSQTDAAKVIGEYYAKIGVLVERVQIRRTMSNVCEGCGCPTGETNYLSIWQESLEKMKKEGYAEADANDKRIILIPFDRYCYDDDDCRWVVSNCCEKGKASWSCYNTKAAPACPNLDLSCAEQEKPKRECSCKENICDSV